MLKKLLMACTLSLMSATAPAMALDLNAMSDEERAQFGEQVRAYLMENPQVIMEAVNALEERQAAAQAQADVDLVRQNAEAIFNDGFSYVGGNPQGDVTLVEFMDYRCGFCKRAFGEVEKLLAADGNIRFVVKEFPILGEQSLIASRFAIATKLEEGRDAYKQMHDALMSYNGDITITALRRLADTFGLNADQIEARMDADEVTQELMETRALAQRLQISGTPTFVLEDEMLRGFLPMDQLQMIVEEKRG
ncbi:DsbA family protein [Roseobacter denitrificans]|uniref:Outer membrane protein, putative n=1 Tax=Roseobacter denitrificans (strain ATCC 33942 / OCh 114) TaxID=375451 RepID=Q165J1_ROSDO|nr:DsbA family protein [Roseobacter denitrificans]ABG32352.1 outer membrane protein, putative [Roseobacter denitrificans OCh 114]AVL51830.1 DsbA family protein [Roseobacter denitrificans]SFF80705.1 Protein-disulfide isomerase [Roseobacter denitrificans OCh 114]